MSKPMSEHFDFDAEFEKSAKLTCFRIQHRKFGLGPYTHDDQNHLHFFHDSNCIVADIDDEIGPILRCNANVRFAFTSLEKCKDFMRNKKGLFGFPCGPRSSSYG